MMDHWEWDSGVEFGLGIKMQIGLEIDPGNQNDSTHIAILCKLRAVSHRIFI